MSPAQPEKSARTFRELSDFFDEFDRYQGWIYRGQSDASWPLTPRLARVTSLGTSHSSYLKARAEHARLGSRIEALLESAELRDHQALRGRLLGSHRRAGEGIA